MASSEDIAYLLKRAIPDALDPIVHRTVHDVLPRTGEGGGYRIAHTGAFSNRVAADLLAFGRNQRMDGALIVIDGDALRAIYYRGGRVVGADSNVLFERLGRVLLQTGHADDASAQMLIEREEAAGVAAAAALMPPDTARFGLERRVWEIAASLFLVHGGNYVIVEGPPNLGAVAPADLSPTDLAIEGLRRYDEWRHGTAGVPIPKRKAPETRPPRSPNAVPAATEAAVDDILRQIRAEH